MGLSEYHPDILVQKKEGKKYCLPVSKLKMYSLRSFDTYVYDREDGLRNAAEIYELNV